MCACGPLRRRSLGGTLAVVLGQARPELGCDVLASALAVGDCEVEKRAITADGVTVDEAGELLSVCDADKRHVRA